MELAIPPRHVNPSGVRRLFGGSELHLQPQRLARIGLQPLKELLFCPICERNHVSGTSLFPETKNL